MVFDVFMEISDHRSYVQCCIIGGLLIHNLVGRIEINRVGVLIKGLEDTEYMFQIVESVDTGWIGPVEIFIRQAAVHFKNHRDPCGI